MRVLELDRLQGLLSRRRVGRVEGIIVFRLESNWTGVAGSAITSQRLLEGKWCLGLPGSLADMPS